MKTSDFDYNLPEELIAQTPLKDRCSSRLLVVDRKTKSLSDQHFNDIINYLNPGDALVLNETKVLPARFYGHRADTGSKIEVLLLKDLGNNTWECLTRPQKRLRAETARSLYFFENEDSNNALFGAHVAKILDDGITHLQFTCDSRELLENLDKIGAMPLPPYIHEKLKDQSRYQTVYAHNLGSAAAPTAGLHFTPELLQKIETKGVKIIKITLHVGLGTFRPVQVDDVAEHKMHTEAYEISEQAAKEINETKTRGSKIIAVGTTTVRTLETVATKYGKIQADKGETDIFIYPGYSFKIVDGLITNFHLPKSTLLMLVSAFADKDLIMTAYHHAIQEKYRFFSFGDAMFIK